MHYLLVELKLKQLIFFTLNYPFFPVKQKPPWAVLITYLSLSKFVPDYKRYPMHQDAKILRQHPANCLQHSCTYFFINIVLSVVTKGLN